MKKILCVVPELGTGGLERVLITVANHIDKKRFSFTIMVLKPGFDEILDQLNPDVKVLRMGITGKLRFEMRKIMKAVKREKPDILYSTSNGLNAQMAPWILSLRIFHGIKAIARVVILLSYRYGPKRYKIFSYLHNAYNTVVAQSLDMRDDLIRGGTSKRKITVINNPVDTEKILRDSRKDLPPGVLPSGGYRLVAAGRLSYQKNFPALIQRVAENRDLGINLTILGEGEDRPQLEALIKELQCGDLVNIAGYQTNPFSILRNGDLFVLSSRFEGFPNAILEALTCGLPVLANNCPGGINEIIIEGENGLLCNIEDGRDFREKLIKCRETQFQRESISRGTEEKFGIRAILHRYEDVFDSV